MVGVDYLKSFLQTKWFYDWFYIFFVYLLPRFENYGIYVVMFWEILRTLIRIAVVFFFLILAFGLSFFVLLGSQVSSIIYFIFYSFKYYLWLKHLKALFANFISCVFSLFWCFFLQQTYSTPLLSVMKTFAMMLGDINYHDAFLDPLLSSELPYPFLSYTVLIIFTLLIPILLMNLLVSKLFINTQKWLNTILYREL